MYIHILTVKLCVCGLFIYLDYYTRITLEKLANTIHIDKNPSLKLNKVINKKQKINHVEQKDRIGDDNDDINR